METHRKVLKFSRILKLFEYHLCFLLHILFYSLLCCDVTESQSNCPDSCVVTAMEPQGTTILDVFVNGPEFCCSLCRNRGPLCVGWDYNPETKFCNAWRHITSCSLGSKTLYGSMKEGTCDCEANIEAYLKKDPHLMTLDGAKIDLVKMPVQDSIDPRLNAKYLLLRTVQCVKTSDQNEEIVPMNVEVELEHAYSHGRSGLKSLRAEFHFEHLYPGVGKLIKISLTITNHTVEIHSKADGIDVSSSKICSKKEKICSPGTPTIRTSSTKTKTGGPTASIAIPNYGLTLSLSKLDRSVKVDISELNPVYKSLQGNLFGLVGNMDGNKENDLFCPGTKNGKLTPDAMCFEITSDGSRNKAILPEKPREAL